MTPAARTLTQLDPPRTEADTENQIRAAFLAAGWYPVKTDAGMIRRGQKKKHGHIPTGFPDMTFLYGLPGGLALAALVEVKTRTGTVSPDQIHMHRTLRQQYGLTTHVMRTAAEAHDLIAHARTLTTRLQSPA
ncbi:hypothetical protein [Deinococcus sp. 6GRE01]|uniref:hypothetical protein n=1 Tax=Deinococcus sp. 6GRE01 TaxID=2745873 RepID=UPI001E55AEDE|nr:hypothetical protein [Deinococcus sp. 6GRE01]MCD0156254.1 hypothetical protein [Deinococcus sp. 6GRE01]